MHFIATDPSVGFFAERNSSLVDIVLGGARHLPRPIHAASNPADPPTAHFPAQRIGDCFRRAARDYETLILEQIDHLEDGGGAVYGEINREKVAELGAAQYFSLHDLRFGHHTTVAFRVDIFRRPGDKCTDACE